MNDQLLSFIEHQYGFTGKLSELASYIDKNYLLRTITGEKYVVKLANMATPVEDIQLENLAITHVFEQNLNVESPQLILSKEKKTTLIFHHAELSWTLRLLSWIDGTLYHQAINQNESQHKSKIQNSLGELVGQLTHSLNNFDTKEAHRTFRWDIAQLELLEPELKYYSGTKQACLQRHFTQFVEHTKPLLGKLPCQIIHNDCNDYNIVTQASKDGYFICSGVFDFGDTVYTQRICDLAVTLTYALFHEDNILEASRNIITGYLLHTRLKREELALLLDLVNARLVQSLLNSGKSIFQDPDNDYLLVSQQPAWDLLSRLDNIDRNAFLNLIESLN